MSTTLSKEDYSTMQEADIIFDGEMAKLLNRNGHASWTVCPSCGIDDFCHVEGCSLFDPDEIFLRTKR